MPRASTTSDAFNAVAEPRRRTILTCLASRECPVGEIAETLSLDQPSVSKHLRVLRSVGLVRVRCDGRHKYLPDQRRGHPPAARVGGTFERLWQRQLLASKHLPRNR
jgi:DNA-binding transcriptional ArsR family regulator